MSDNMLLLAAATTLEKVEKIPPSTWLKLAGLIAAFVVAVVLLRKVAQMNKVVLSIIVLVVLSVVGFSWIYNRNEPEFLTPVINKIAPFFPSKGAYYGKQQETPKM